MGKKVLIAEDDEMIQKILIYRLKKDGYELYVASDGKEAKKIIEENKPNLVLTDIMLPFASGLEIVNFIRNEIRVSTPVIVLSALGLEKTVLEAFGLGADDFVTKPFSPHEISMRIKRLLKPTNPQA